MFGHINSLRHLISDTIKSRPNFIRNTKKRTYEIKVQTFGTDPFWGPSYLSNGKSYTKYAGIFTRNQ